ncbi:hypothetical protein JB92DRAFT_2824646 [Gautieria morchelliformis]|nr:hypothetical protein JB92DRAFT_2824646 [Gautieria morchelliformis]
MQRVMFVDPVPRREAQSQLAQSHASIRPGLHPYCRSVKAGSNPPLSRVRRCGTPSGKHLPSHDGGVQRTARALRTLTVAQVAEHGEMWASQRKFHQHQQIVARQPHVRLGPPVISPWGSGFFYCHFRGPFVAVLARPHLQDPTAVSTLDRLPEPIAAKGYAHEEGPDGVPGSITDERKWLAREEGQGAKDTRELGLAVAEDEEEKVGGRGDREREDEVEGADGEEQE